MNRFSPKRRNVTILLIGILGLVWIGIGYFAYLRQGAKVSGDLFIVAGAIFIGASTLAFFLSRRKLNSLR
jgi:hypothetical protein